MTATAPEQPESPATPHSITGAAVGASFVTAYGHSPAGVWAAPGRVNLIGEHTDYNDGFVLPLALEASAVIAAAPAAGGGSRLTSAQQPDATIRFSVADLQPGSVPGWAAYVAGVLWSFREAGYAVPDLDLYLDSDVPIGAGLSSSAALECATGLALAELLGLTLAAEPGPTTLTRTDLALLAKRAENDYVGAATGVMDQMASVHGRAGHLVFIDTRSLAVEAVPFDVAAHGLRLVVIDTKAPHALVDGQYAARRTSCEQAAALLGVTALRDVPGDGLIAALARIEDPVMRRRVRHVVTEDERVLSVVQTLRDGGDPREIGPLLTASHASMRDDFEITVPHVDVAVAAALAAGAVGARMTGGGFGGSIIALVETDRAASMIGAIEEAYVAHGFGPPVAFDAVPGAGARRLGD